MKDREPIGMADREVEFEKPKLTSEREQAGFISSGMLEVAEAARYSVSPTPTSILEISEAESNEAIARALSKVTVEDPNLARVDPSVDTIEGIFLAESEFKTGVASSQFNARGSVVAYEGVSLQRDLGAPNANTPAEVFTYAPDIIATFPRVFTQRRMRWKEVAP